MHQRIFLFYSDYCKYCFKKDLQKCKIKSFELSQKTIFFLKILFFSHNETGELKVIKWKGQELNFIKKIR